MKRIIRGANCAVAASNTAEFTFKPEGNRTIVTWSMAGRIYFMFKAVGLFMNLAQLKSVAEAEGRQ